MRKLFLKIGIFDGSYLLHRCLHTPSLFELRNSKGIGTGGIFGVLRAINRELKKCGNYFPIVCFDDGLSPRRVSADIEYKKSEEKADLNNRILTPEESKIDFITQYRTQRNILVEILKYFGIPCLKFIPWEGDDLISLIVKLSNECVIITDDRDMLQLLSESCKVRRPMADELWTLEDFLKSMDITDIYDFVIIKAILGDNSDNIKSSCRGVGDKTVNGMLPLLKLFYVDGIWNFNKYPKEEKRMKLLCDSIDTKYRKAFLNFSPERFIINMELVDLEKVVFTDEVYNSVISTITNSKAYVDYFKAVSSMSELEIREFSVDELLESVNNRYSNLLLEGV